MWWRRTGRYGPSSFTSTGTFEGTCVPQFAAVGDELVSSRRDVCLPGVGPNPQHIQRACLTLFLACLLTGFHQTAVKNVNTNNHQQVLMSVRRAMGAIAVHSRWESSLSLTPPNNAASPTTLLALQRFSVTFLRKAMWREWASVALHTMAERP